MSWVGIVGVAAICALLLAPFIRVLSGMRGPGALRPRLVEVLLLVFLGSGIGALVDRNLRSSVGSALGPVEIAGFHVFIFVMAIGGVFTGACWGWSAADRLVEPRIFRRLLLLMAGVSGLAGCVALVYLAQFAFYSLRRQQYGPAWPLACWLLILPALAVEWAIRRGGKRPTEPP